MVFNLLRIVGNVYNALSTPGRPNNLLAIVELIVLKKTS